MKTFLISVLLLTGISLPALSQKTYHQTVYWLRYQNQLFFSPSLYWTNEIDNRRFINPDVQTQLIFHSRLHKKKGKWDMAGGLTYSLAYAAIPENGPRKPLAEVRPVVEISHEEPIRTVFLQNRLRIDNRFLQENREESLWDESNYVLRFRYRLQVRFPLKKNESNVTTIGVRLADEVMFNAEENFYDQNRIYATADFFLNRSWALEAGYIYIHQQRFGRDDEFFKRHVLRFSVQHKLFLTK